MLVPAWACFHAGAGVLGLLLFGLSAFIGPVKVTIDRRGITFKALFFRTEWAQGTIERVVHEGQEWPAWVRRPSLMIQRKGLPMARVIGSAAQLSELMRGCEGFGFATKR